MSLSILNNIPSLEAQNQLAMTNTNLQNTLFQLSSGSKINSGADDPAGMSISDGLQANISALTQSAQNVTDGVGMLQTADGALSQVTTLLNRAVTLATEAGNAGLTTDQQNALQTEFTSITQEINQIGSNTTYNNNQVFTNQLTSVFLSDGSQVDSADPTISVTIPTLSSQSLGLSSYATGTIDLLSNPNAGNTVQIGQQSYTFVASGAANAAGEVAVGANVQTTLQNLQNAVNGTGTASPGTYGVGTAANAEAQITSVNGGSATVQATAAGNAGNSVQLVTNLTSSGGTSGANLSGAVNATYDTGTLSLNAQPGVVTTATGSVTMTGQATTLTRATGVFNLGANQPSTGTISGETLDLAGSNPVTGNATGSLTLINVQAGDTVTLGTGANAQTYTFVASDANFDGNGNEIAINGSLSFAASNLQNAIDGTGIVGVYYSAGTVSGAATGAVISSSDTLSGQFTFASTTINQASAVDLAFNNAAGGSGSVSGLTAGHLTYSGTESDTVTLGGTTYTFVAAGTSTAGNEIALGADANGTLQNLQAALAGGAGSSGTFHVTGGAANNAVSMTISGGGSGDSATFSPSGGGGLALSATGSLGSELTTTGSAGDTVTVGSQTYSFVAAGAATAANEVALGISIQDTLTNLMDAVNGIGGGSASTFGAGTAAAGDATMALSATPGEALLTAANGGVGGNSIALTSSITGAANPTATLSGGLDADTMTIGSSTYTFVAAGQAVNAGEVSVGANVNATLTNLMDAVNGIGAGSNTTYGAGTAQNLAAIISGVSNGVATVEAAIGGVAVPGAAGDSVALAVTSAAGTGTVSGANLSGGAAADTVTVGSVTYTFVAAGQATAGNEVALGATGQATLDNLKAAVNSTAVASGSAATYHLADATQLQGATGATITSDAGGVATVQAEVAGVLGSPIGLSVSFAGGNATGTLAGLSTGDLSGGAAASAASGNFDLTGNPASGNTVTVGSQTYTFVAAGMANAANEVALGSDVQGTLNNLKEAVNNGPNGTGAGTDYGTGTVANTSATITSVSGGQATVTAITPGTAGNAVAISATLSNGENGGVVGVNNLNGGGSSVDLSSAADAQAALTVIAGAISTVASTRGAIGSSINQMNAAVQVMNNTTQNLTSSLSGIQDANIGQVVANMSKYQVLEQTGIAALTQANQQEQTVLKLLQ